MKNKVFLSLFLIIIWGCNKRLSPEEVSDEYLNALKNNDFEKAKLYSSEEMISYLDRMKENKIDLSKIYTEIKDINCKTDSNISTCFFCCISDTCQTNEIVLKRKNEESDWKVIPIKETGPCDTE